MTQDEPPWARKRVLREPIQDDEIDEKNCEFPAASAVQGATPAALEYNKVYRLALNTGVVVSPFVPSDFNNSS